MARREGRVIGIVDDDSSLRRSLRNLLMSVGYRVETFESAEAFLQSGDRDEIGCVRSEEHTSELQSQSNLVCRLLLEKKKKKTRITTLAKFNTIRAATATNKEA